MAQDKLDYALLQNSQLEGEKNQSTHNKWHCNGDCQSFGDFLGCPGEKNIDNDSEYNCPYYLPEM